MEIHLHEELEKYVDDQVKAGRFPTMDQAVRQALEDFKLRDSPARDPLLGLFSDDDRRVALQCLAQVGLADFAARRADTLSGGEQQRVAIARALAQAPSLILADEPTASLDPPLTGSIMDLLKRINVQRGLTLVVSQHQLETALAYATRVVGFRRGRVVFDGPPAALTPPVAATIYAEAPAP